MGAWLLVGALMLVNGAGGVSAEFASQAACKSAYARLEQKCRDEGRCTVIAVCVPKSLEHDAGMAQG